MAHVTFLSTDGAPKAVGPYSQAAKHGRTLYVSGQLGLDPKTMAFAAEDTAGQAKQALTNLGAILSEAGLSPTCVVKVNIFLVDMADFPAMNEVYAAFFGEHKPARSTVAVAALPMGGRFEIECVAVYAD